jgi:hypothetical protein
MPEEAHGYCGKAAMGIGKYPCLRDLRENLEDGVSSGSLWLCGRSPSRNIHALFEVKMAGEAHGYCGWQLCAPVVLYFRKTEPSDYSA